MPGHKRGVGIDPELEALLGKNLFRLDLPELPGLDQHITNAQLLAADAYGSERTWFLVNGSTSGVAAMMLAVCAPEQKILIGRNCHKAAIAGLVLAGAMPVYLETDYDDNLDLDLGVSSITLETALALHPDAKAVMIVSPNYYGVCGEIENLVAIAHTHSLPILVDAAHGAHLPFHPDLPVDAIAAGADLVVQSTHKMGSSLTQTAMLHGQGDRVDLDRVDQAVQLLQSTSPNLILLTSLDVARRQMAIYGKDLLTKTIDLANQARSQINQIPNLTCVAAIPTLDSTRLTIMVDQLGITGFAADQILHSDLNLMVEMPTFRQLVLAISIGNTEADIQTLVTACRQLSLRSAAPEINRKQLPFNQLPKPLQKLTPRAAFIAPSRSVPWSMAIGRVSAELICPYPPGIPAICPGEEITKAIADFLIEVKDRGGVIYGCADSSLETIRVLN
jgi:arginine decarboxylase